MAVIVGGLLGGAAAHEGATGIVGERMDGMKMMSRAIKALAQTLEAPAPDPAVIREAARTISDHAGATMTSLFPPGSMEEPSVAMAAIWEDWDEFSRLADYLRDLGGGLALASDGGPANDGGGETPAAAPPRSPQSLWASLDERALLGLGPSVVPVTSAAPAPQVSSPTARQTFVAITRTCSDCHAKFRRQQ